MESSNNTLGDIRTLKQITEDNVVTEIVIPKFQRDYAQGRPGKEELRGNFLEDLFKVIENPDTKAPQRVYDFIYGQQETPNSKHPDTNRFFPIDGQQRLTTIFILTLYIGKRGGKDTGFLKKFSYETRDSSLQFCNWMCEVDASNYADIITFLNDHPKMTGAWQSDPTISGMKQTLNDIHCHFSSITDADFELYWRNVTEKVAFWRLYITDLDATDDLYIKMNSRGKHLSDFENFKASVDQLAKNSGKVSGEFSKEMDTTWTNLFWGYRDKSNDLVIPDYNNPEQQDFTDNGLDEKMLTFFRNYLIIEGVKSGALSKSADAEILSSIVLVKRILSVSPNLFQDIELILRYLDGKKDSCGQLSTYFGEFLTTYEEEKRFNDNPNDQTIRVNLLFKSGIDLFNDMMSGDLSLNQKLVIEAFFKYILLLANGNGISVDEFKDRLRILRNLIANSYPHDDANHPGTMKENLKSVDKLVEHGLSAIMSLADEFSGVQKSHEDEKLQWMSTASPNDIITLKQVENYEVVRGNLTQIKGTSQYSAKKFQNFREIFKYNADYDFIEKVMIAFGNYEITGTNGNGTVYNYAGPSKRRFSNVIFVSANDKSLDTFEKLLTEKCVSDSALMAFCTGIESISQVNKQYDWRYYMTKYKPMRWAPTGHYLLPFGNTYLRYMFRASTCYHSDSYLHWNVYNETVRCECGFDGENIDKYGGALTIPGANVKMDILEDRINLHLADGMDYFTLIPQTNGIDSVDRIIFAKNIADKFRSYATHTENDENGKEVIRFTSIDSSDLNNIEFDCDIIRVEEASQENITDAETGEV